VGRSCINREGKTMLTSMRGLLAATLLAGTSLAAMPALADETAPPSDITITGSAAIVSQYRFRGLAQSDNKPAVQASITVAHKSGFYISTWGSSASAGNGPINIGGTEIDIYGGWTHGIGDSGFTVDVGGYGYIYPGAPLGDYYEIYGSVAKTFGPVTAKAGVYVAPGQDVFNYNFTSPDHHNLYVYGELGGGIPGTPLSVHTHLGHTNGGFEWSKPYFDYNAGISYKWKALTFDVSVVGTDVSRDDISNGFGSTYPLLIAAGTCTGATSCTDYYRRMSKTVVVGSLTASF
jgi:uncharacterized protein (TIGR02001 family)